MSAASRPAPLLVAGNPTGTPAWRQSVAAAARGLSIGSGFSTAFVLRPGRWVDLDTLTESTARGLRDASALQPRYAGLDAVLATKRFAADHGVTITPSAAADLDGPPPGRSLLDAQDSAVPRPGNREAKRAWRAAVAKAWNSTDVLEERCWADIELGVSGSLFGPLEVVLDSLEPVLGRDPRGRDWQEFFPNDDRIEWLRVRRRSGGPGVRLQMGPLP